MYVCVYIYIRIYTDIYIDMAYVAYVHVRTHTRTHTRAHAHTHTVCRLFRPRSSAASRTALGTAHDKGYLNGTPGYAK